MSITDLQRPEKEQKSSGSERETFGIGRTWSWPVMIPRLVFLSINTTFLIILVNAHTIHNTYTASNNFKSKGTTELNSLTHGTATVGHDLNLKFFLHILHSSTTFLIIFITPGYNLPAFLNAYSMFLTPL